jgi:hypothetical protein
VPVGVVGGRWLWTVTAGVLGVAPVPVTPLVWLSLLAAAALVVANLVALVPAMTATRTPTTSVLRVE